MTGGVSRLPDVATLSRTLATADSKSVIVTKKRTSAANVLAFLNGRGCQEAILGEAKEHAALGYIPCRCRVANPLYSLAAMFSHNLAHELSSGPRHYAAARRPPEHPSSS